MVFDPGTRGFEAGSPGTAYVGFSRVTTMGEGDIAKSALYLSGKNVSLNRFVKMTV